MKVDAAAAAKSPGLTAQAAGIYESATGQSVTTWALLALLNLLTQTIVFGEMWGRAPAIKSLGEFGTFNAALGIIGLLTAPLLAFREAFRLFFARAQSTRLDRLRESAVTLVETAAWIWGGCCFVLILLPMPLPYLPRFALQLFTLMNVLLALGGVVSSALCEDGGQRRRWALLLVGAAGTRLVLGGWFAAYQPWAEAILAAFLVAGFITLAPVLRPRDLDAATRLKACLSLFDREFLHFAAATLSALVGIYLFTNADRIAALGWLNLKVGDTVVPSAEMQNSFDTYQATGLLARSILWGTQPLLWLLYAERSKLNKSTAASLRFLWIYLGMLVAGAVVLDILTQKWAGSRFLPVLGTYGPTFAIVTVPLGILQAFGIFSLASRRYPECFTLGGCGVVYALVLALFGHRPEIMLPYMFGLALVSMMVVLMVGVVRWGRRQP